MISDKDTWFKHNWVVVSGVSEDGDRGLAPLIEFYDYVRPLDVAMDTEVAMWCNIMCMCMCVCEAIQINLSAQLEAGNMCEKTAALIQNPINSAKTW